MGPERAELLWQPCASSYASGRNSEVACFIYIGSGVRSCRRRLLYLCMPGVGDDQANLKLRVSIIGRTRDGQFAGVELRLGYMRAPRPLFSRVCAIELL